MLKNEPIFVCCDHSEAVVCWGSTRLCPSPCPSQSRDVLSLPQLCLMRNKIPFKSAAEWLERQLIMCEWCVRILLKIMFLFMHDNEMDATECGSMIAVCWDLEHVLVAMSCWIWYLILLWYFTIDLYDYIHLPSNYESLTPYNVT